ncbi:AT-hook motif nuclear-localized protein 7-like [Prunus avium]|uniref:AT-hook motif nuclear-localized protein n=1 Tax=Prunus avium TaxID=42229 RepID=A0A6P5S576_PRUAV|nr:AT-hook motif nuclear-localized protein 7-like [Prunus avium]
MVSFPQIPQIDDGPPNDMIYFPQTPQTSQIESESGSNLDSNEEEEISVKRKMGTLMTYGELDHYALTVQTGEDVVSEMFSLSQRTSRSLWILSATGAVLDVVLRKPGSSGGLLNFKGSYQLISLSGSFEYGENNNVDGENSRLNITLSHHDGKVFGGLVTGSLIAAEPVYIIAASLKQGTSKDTSQELKMRRSAN